MQLDIFTKQYITTAFWSSTDDIGIGESLDENYGPQNINQRTMKSIVEDCAKFQRENKKDIDNRDSDAGHDFWLTRNGHGAGFWDGDWPEPAAHRLTKASEAFGELSLYVDDDGEIGAE